MRIIAGKFKGKILSTFDEQKLIRPTTDKVREAIFSKIQFDLVDSEFLDLFGGSGAIGLEALSRGASRVVVCDNSIDSANLIKKNYEKCGIKPNLFLGDYNKSLDRLASQGMQFDFIYIDPPYNMNVIENILKIIIESRLLSERGMIIYEHLFEKPFINNTEKLKLLDSKKYGTISVEFLEWANV